MAQDQRKSTENMTLYARRALILRVSFASTTAKLWWLFLHSKSTLIRRDCRLPLHHPVNLFWSHSRSSQRTVSQICAPRFASSFGCKYRRGRIFDDELRPERVDERCGHWNEDVLSRNCRLDESYVGFDLFGSEKLTWWSILSHYLVDQLLWQCDIWLNLALGEFFDSQVRRGHHVQVFSLALLIVLLSLLICKDMQDLSAHRSGVTMIRVVHSLLCLPHIFFPAVIPPHVLLNTEDQMKNLK